MNGRAPKKPPEGAPCNGCGMCCAAERCKLSVMAVGPGPGPCPLMTFHGGRFWCGLVEMERDQGKEPMLADALGIGKGCCGSLESEH